MMPQPDNSMPKWMKWTGLVVLGIGAGLLNVTTEGGHVSAFEVCKHVFLSLGVSLTGGAVKTS
jgi:hypothetical protein